MIEATVRLPVAARAIGTTPKSLEHWLAGGFAMLCDRRPDRAWRAVAPIDLIRLAVVRRLMGYGVTLAEAEKVLANTVDGLLLAYPLSGLPCRWPIVLGKLAGRTLTVSRDADGGLRASHASMFGPDVGDMHGAERVLLDLHAIADATRARIEPNVPPASSASPGGADVSKARLGKAGGTRSRGKPGSPAPIEETAP